MAYPRPNAVSTRLVTAINPVHHAFRGLIQIHGIFCIFETDMCFIKDLACKLASDTLRSGNVTAIIRFTDFLNGFCLFVQRYKTPYIDTIDNIGILG